MVGHTRRAARAAIVIPLAFAFAATPSFAQTFTHLAHQPPDGAIFTMQLTDGTVLAQGGSETKWRKLTPDNTGSYVNGTWTQVARLPAGYSPYAQAEAVLADGRVVVSGGEYNFDQNGDGLHGCNVVRNEKGTIVYDKHIDFND